MRLCLAVWCARLVGALSRLLGRGGSSLPGKIARRIDPDILTKLTRNLPQGTVLLTGTNGKTTTAAMTAQIFSAHGWSLVHNRAGANLIVGLTASLVQSRRWGLYPRADLALLETDEATMPRAAQETNPRAIVVTNFFRDQLDRYGELSTTVSFVARGIEHLRPGGFLVLNADDPQVAFLGYGAEQVVYYGLNLPEVKTGNGFYDVADARFCPRCGQTLTYDRRYYAHVGHYWCAHCRWQRPRPDLAVTEWDRAAGRIHVLWKDTPFGLTWDVPGVYNLYNQAAALAVGLGMGTSPSELEQAVREFRPAFGRMENITVGANRVWLTLIKNPVGFNQVLDAVAGEDEETKIALVMINDRYADGRDVSWLWDVDFEGLIPAMNVAHWWVSGDRAHDMAVRLKYAGVPASRISVEPDPARSFDQARSLHPQAALYIMPTYTALLDFRQYLTRNRYVRHFRQG